MIEAKLYIAGEWVGSSHTDTITEKYTGRALATIPVASREDVAAAVAAAKEAFTRRLLTPYQRFEVLRRAADLLRARSEEFAEMIAREGGKPLKEARAEAQRAVQTFEISAEEAKRIGGEVVPVAAAPGSERRIAFTLRDPVGVVAAISPFNFPLNLVAHKVAPAIAAGCSVVLKPAPQTPISSYLLCRLLEEAGVPRGLVNFVHGGAEVGEALTASPDVHFFSFTGSPKVGLAIKRAAGLRRTLLELGSNSAVIVHGDADLDAAADLAARRGFGNAGQVCISVQRLLVHRPIWETFIEKLVAVTQSLVVGDPVDPKTDVGPMISEGEAQRAMLWIEEAIAGGARALTGPGRRGSVLEPTILIDVKPEMRVVCQEVFAPVLTLVPYDSLDEAIAITNDSIYGLQAGVFTRSLDVAMKAAREIRTGGVMINDTSSYRVDQMPYGGVKESGNGREGPRYAIEEMTETKIVVLNL